MHHVIILAAGGSSRLGQPKALLQADGETLIHRVLRIADATGAASLQLITGAEHDALLDELDDFTVQATCNTRWQQGLASSLQCAARLPLPATDDVLLVVVDQLFLDRKHLDALLAARAAHPHAVIVSAYAGTRGIPVLMPMALLQQQAVTLQGDSGLKALWHDPQQTVVAISNEALARDLDTPDDLQQAIADGEIDAPDEDD